MTRWVIALLVAVVLGPWAGSADAHHHHHHRHARHAAVQKRYSPIWAAYTIAARYWGEQPCNGDLTVRYEVPPAAITVPAFMVPGMWASWDPGTPYENQETAPQPFFGCVIGINPEVWPTEYFMAFTAWRGFLVQWLHEAGHFRGLGHSTDPASVMFFGQLAEKPEISGEYAPGWGP